MLTSKLVINAGNGVDAQVLYYIFFHCILASAIILTRLVVLRLSGFGGPLFLSLSEVGREKDSPVVADF